MRRIEPFAPSRSRCAFKLRCTVASCSRLSAVALFALISSAASAAPIGERTPAAAEVQASPAPAATGVVPAPDASAPMPPLPAAAPPAAAPPGAAPPGAAPAEAPTTNQLPPLPAAPASPAAPAPAAGGPAPAAEAPRGRDERRAVPDYGRREQGSSLGRDLLWVPRVVLFPLYLGTEYLLRRPLGWIISGLEREHSVRVIIDFLTWDDRRAGIAPTLALDLGLRPSAGLYAFFNDLFVQDNQLRLRAAYGGTDFYALRLADRFPLGPGELALRAAYESRPDNVFYGIGTNSAAPRARYFAGVARGGIDYTLPWFRSSSLRVLAQLREVHLDGGRHCCGDAPVDARAASGYYATPPGIDQVYDVADQGVELVLDSRSPLEPARLPAASDYVAGPRTGLRFEAHGAVSELLDQSLGTDASLSNAWLRYGGALGGHLQVFGQERAIGVTALVDFSDPLGSAGSVPISDLSELGGDRPLQAFLPHRFVDRSAAALRLDYRWPVALSLDGALFYEAGNVFGAHLSGFQLPQLRSSFGIGIASAEREDHRFQALIAFGTTSYESAARLDAVRLVFGTTAGF